MEVQYRVGAGGGLWRWLMIGLLVGLVAYLALDARQVPAPALVGRAEAVVTTPAPLVQVIVVQPVLRGEAAPMGTVAMATPTATVTATPEATGRYIYLPLVLR